MKEKRFITALFMALAAIIWVTSAQAFTITAGEYRFVVAEAYTQLVDPTNAAVGDEAYQGNQWAIARINEVQILNTTTSLYDTIWSQGSTVPDPPAGTTDQYITAVFGGLTLQVDANNPVSGVNTPLSYNEASDTTAAKDYVNTNVVPPTDYTDVYPHNSYFVSDIGQRTQPYEPGPDGAPGVVNVDDDGDGIIDWDPTTGEADPDEFGWAGSDDTATPADVGSAFLKVYSNPTNIFNLDVAAGPGTGGGGFGTFGTNITSGTLLIDASLDPLALALQDSTGESIDGQGELALLRTIGVSDTETGVNAFFQTEGPTGVDIHGDGYGAWDWLFDSDSAQFFGADGNIDFTARALIGSPYLPFVPGAGADPQSGFGWDFRDVGQALTASPIPEPSTMLLLGAGLLGLAAYGRKRNSH